MNRKLASLIAISFGAGLAAACSSANVAAGLDEGGVDAKTKLCGDVACTAGDLCCPQACSSTPVCLSITRCPANWEGTCPVQDSGSPRDGGATDSGTEPPPDAGADAGEDCCPVGFDMYACTEADGGQGLACHNPAKGCASSLTCGQGCDPVVTGRCGTATNLQWYTTCGYPVCEVRADAGPDGGSADAGVSCEPVGTACSSKGDTCGTPTNANCGVTLVCDDHDPKGPSGRECPISSRTFKNGIQYVGDAELRALHDEALGMRLATYNYKAQVADPHPKHLGFIIEDNPQSLAVDQTHNRVDLYGYVSMVVAAMQVQEKEIASLKRELAETRQNACSRSTLSK
jgi:hypothetical protein